MTKEEIIEAINDIDEDILCIITDCFKEMVCNGVPMFVWDKYAILDVLEDTINKNDYILEQ